MRRFGPSPAGIDEGDGTLAEMRRSTDPRFLLLVDGREVAPLEVARGPRARARGLLGRTGLEGALLLAPARSIHTVAMRFPIDVAWCRADLRVVAVATVDPGRLTGPRRGARAVVEAEAGSFEAWGLRPGCQLGQGWSGVAST
jgi:hypothetical protein